MEIIIKEFIILHKEFYETFESWRKNLQQHPYTNGIYTLKAGKSIPRALGTDHNGILYIGKGIILSPNHRLGNLINALNDTDKKHEAGVRYNDLGFYRIYPLNQLILEIELALDSRETEKERLAKYLYEFGELPPLNRQS